jgi:two-component system, NtrC family, response regulator HydG
MGSMWCLAAISGPIKGLAWGLGAAPLVIGRSRQCQVYVPDPLVSRTHCELAIQDKRLVLRDLGSSNATLVNGRPVYEARLRPGDELGIGPCIFLIMRLERHAAPSEAEHPEEPIADRTTTWAIHGNKEGAAVVNIAEARPQTVQDLAQLFEIGRELGTVAAISDLLEVLRRRIRERFGNVPVWFARCQGDDELIIFDDGSGNVESAPMAAMTRAIKEGRPLYVSAENPRTKGSAPVTTFVAPILCGGAKIGAIGWEQPGAVSAATEGHLLYLMAIAYEAAPHFLSVERLEQLQRDIGRLRARAGESTSLIGQSIAIQDVRQALREAAQANLSVLVLGETGTGKELAARLVHDSSRRASGPFVVVNCAAIPPSLFESEMFGHERGAFTGADRTNVGRVQQAHGGTLFLDEIGELSSESQARMLRLVELGTFHRVGATQETKVDIRIVAATNRDIPALAARGQFREDLYHRLNGFEITMPPLRARPEDIPLLAGHFLDLARHEAKRPIRGLHPDAIAYLRERPWPGNVRELRRCIERAVALARSDMIGLEDLLVYGAPAEAKTSTELRPLATVERDHIANVLRQCGGKVADAAQVLGIGRSTLYNKISEYELDT